MFLTIFFFALLAYACIAGILGSEANWKAEHAIMWPYVAWVKVKQNPLDNLRKTEDEGGT